ncbi:hypothetical protein BC477_16340 [Clavibacter michiganensis subsp. michiganensis]|nr:hypothetical protein BC477_16340 [Clavibacter michiganensis subsp. michiganensis]
MHGDRVVVGIKSSTTEDVTSGIVGALAECSGYTGSAVSDGTSVREARTASIERGISTGSRPSGAIRPVSAASTAVSELP